MCLCVCVCVYYINHKNIRNIFLLKCVFHSKKTRCQKCATSVGIVSVHHIGLTNYGAWTWFFHAIYMQRLLVSLIRVSDNIRFNSTYTDNDYMHYWYTRISMYMDKYKELIRWIVSWINDGLNQSIVSSASVQASSPQNTKTIQYRLQGTGLPFRCVSGTG